MASKNSNLNSAKKAKNDEFYTLIEDIEKEIYHYGHALEGKTVYCNCDDPLDSAFTRYFILRFKALKLKKLICTFYDITNNKNAFAFVYEGQDINGSGIITESDIDIIKSTKAFHYPLVDDEGFDFENKEACWKKSIYGKGDFRSQNCIDYLKMSDIVITNPPFSLFREYILQLMSYNKKFIVIGNKNAITAKQLFPYIKNNEMWWGITHPKEYRLPDGNLTTNKKEMTRWFTNVTHTYRNEELRLYKKYSPEKYPTYDNYNAIDIKEVKCIPEDHYGIMGVPITFLDKYCPTQFEFIGIDRYVEDNPRYGHRFTINGKETYARLLIRRKRTE